MPLMHWRKRGGIPGSSGLPIWLEMFPGLEIILYDFKALANSFEDMQEPLIVAIQHVMMPSILQNFEVGGRPPWPDLAEATITVRLTEGSDAILPLVRTGMLAARASSFEAWTIEGSGDEGSAYITPDNLTEYALYHQMGTSVMPAREFLLFQPEDLDAIQAIMEDYTAVRLEAAGWLRMN